MRGHVQDIKGENDDEFWSINVKKGVLSLLEMNFEERRSSSKKERLVELNRDRSSPVDYYKVMEVKFYNDADNQTHDKRLFPNVCIFLRVLYFLTKLLRNNAFTCFKQSF